ncbi:MAG: helix-turn-helix domain-containing protein [Rikenellaceae bacterium]|nr:helix-turn-helix domain-containing protein [Rikenellaceae bacterium]
MVHEGELSTEVGTLIEKLKEATSNISDIESIRHPDIAGERYYSSSELCKMLHISPRTLQDHRDTGRIPFIRLFGKILYKGSDISKLLEENYIKSIDCFL